MTIEAAVLARAETGVTTQRLASLFDAHHQRLYRLARRLSADGDEARDLVQETFLRAARRPSALPAADDECEAWLVRVLVNLCRDQRRRRRVRLDARETLRGAMAPTPAGDGAIVARITVAAALARLSPRRRAVIVLHELEDREAATIARLLGISQVTVRWHLMAGRRELKKFLAGEQEDEE